MLAPGSAIHGKGTMEMKPLTAKEIEASKPVTPPPELVTMTPGQVTATESDKHLKPAEEKKTEG